MFMLNVKDPVIMFMIMPFCYFLAFFQKLRLVQNPGDRIGPTDHLTHGKLKRKEEACCVLAITLPK